MMTTTLCLVLVYLVPESDLFWSDLLLILSSWLQFSFPKKQKKNFFPLILNLISIRKTSLIERNMVWWCFFFHQWLLWFEFLVISPTVHKVPSRITYFVPVCDELSSQLDFSDLRSESCADSRGSCQMFKPWDLIHMSRFRCHLIIARRLFLHFCKEWCRFTSMAPF